MFDTSLRTGQLPQDWTDASVSPIHKKGSKMSPNNYRPISLTSQVCKIMEKLLLDNLWRHAVENQLISSHQHGFQKACSCYPPIRMFTWLDPYSGRGWGVRHNLFRLPKHLILSLILVCLKKLENLGIRGHFLKWIETLHSRRQRVVLWNGISGWELVRSGVAQWSNLGPMLFILYVNDLPDTLESTVELFADDTKLYSSIKNLNDCRVVQGDLNKLASWSREWLLNFNASKCVVVRIKNR